MVAKENSEIKNINIVRFKAIDNPFVVEKKTVKRRKLENKLDEETLKRKKRKFKSLKRDQSVYSKIEEEILEKHLDKYFAKIRRAEKIDGYEKLKWAMRNSYNYKSFRQFKYFFNVVTNAYDNTTGEPLTDGVSEEMLANARFDLEMNLVEEAEKGWFLDKKDSKFSNKIYARIKYFDYMYKNFTKCFITVTLPSFYHYYKTKNLKKRLYSVKNMKKNPNFGLNVPFEESIEISIEKLKEIERRLYKTFNERVRKHIKSKYDMTLEEYVKKNGRFFIKFRMFEPHKNLTPHFHGLYYIKPEFYEFFADAFKAAIKHFELNERNCDLQVLKKAAGATYVAKYILKNLATNRKTDETESKRRKRAIKLHNYYRKYFSSYRFFTSSSYEYTTQSEIDRVYRFLYRNFPDFLKYMKTLEVPLFVTIERLIKNGWFKFEYAKEDSFSFDKERLKALLRNFEPISLLAQMKEDAQKMGRAEFFEKYKEFNYKVNMKYFRKCPLSLGLEEIKYYDPNENYDYLLFDTFIHFYHFLKGNNANFDEYFKEKQNFRKLEFFHTYHEYLGDYIYKNGDMKKIENDFSTKLIDATKFNFVNVDDFRKRRKKVQNDLIEEIYRSANLNTRFFMSYVAYENDDSSYPYLVNEMGLYCPLDSQIIKKYLVIEPFEDDREEYRSIVYHLYSKFQKIYKRKKPGDDFDFSDFDDAQDPIFPYLDLTEFYYDGNYLHYFYEYVKEKADMFVTLVEQKVLDSAAVDRNFGSFVTEDYESSLKALLENESKRQEEDYLIFYKREKTIK